MGASNDGAEIEGGSMSGTVGASTGARVLARLVSLVDELTPGQRWTTALATGLAIVILLFGLPSSSRVVVPSASAQTPFDGQQLLDDESRVEESAPSTAGAADVRGDPTPAVTRTGSADEVAAPPADPATVPQQPEVTGPTGPVQVVALVDTALAPPGRDDATIAQHFVLDSGLSAAIEPIDDIDRVCAVVSKTRLALASGALPGQLKQCLLEAGVVVISWDDAVAAGPTDSDLSTRRGAARSLVDTARHTRLQGRTALVADARLRPTLEPAIKQAASLGLTFAEVVWLEGEAGTAVALGLAGEQITNVVFATSTSNQSSIATQLRAFVPAASFVVLDAADSVVDQDTSPAMDGALAVTAVQFPWHPGNEAFRSSCRQSWEESQAPPAALGSGELLRALQWCQHVRLAQQAAESLEDDDATLATLQDVSALTSALGTLSDGGFGPTRVTEATWAADCRCWRSGQPFTSAGLP